MNLPICYTCGTQFETANHLSECIICLDERQYVGWEGQRWTTHDELAQKHRILVENDEELLGLSITPSFAIDQRALILPTSKLKIMWESLSLVTADAVKALGRIDLIVISHPHFYSSMIEWSEALGGVPILLHEADQMWIQRSSPQVKFWKGDEYEVTSGITLIRCGGHFPGSTALHWQDKLRPSGAFFPGDALQVVADRQHVSFMYSYPNHIPMHPDDVRAMRQRLARFAFSDIYGFSSGRNIIGRGRAAVDSSFERYLYSVDAIKVPKTEGTWL